MRVSLYFITEPVLILQWSGPVCYFNQVGGAECVQRALAGAVVPLSLSEAVNGAALAPGLSRCASGGSFTTKQAEEIDELLRTVPLLRGVRVDFGRLSESLEGWLHVIVDPQKCSLIEDVTDELPGVLTWPS